MVFCVSGYNWSISETWVKNKLYFNSACVLFYLFSNLSFVNFLCIFFIYYVRYFFSYIWLFIKADVRMPLSILTITLWKFHKLIYLKCFEWYQLIVVNKVVVINHYSIFYLFSHYYKSLSPVFFCSRLLFVCYWSFNSFDLFDH